MSIPLDRLYHYIESVAQDVYGDTVIYRFYPHGSKNIDDLTEIKYYSYNQRSMYPELICHDQEPLNYEFYKDVPSRQFKFSHLINTPYNNLRIKIYNIYDSCLLLHSECNSDMVTQYQNNGFVPVYYWSHALIARDWFRYAEYCNTKSNNQKQLFLIYNRAWSGTREYRLKFLDLLIENNLGSFCRTSFNSTDPESNLEYSSYNFQNVQFRPTNIIENYFLPTFANSSSSADFDIDDYNSTDIEVVLETLFDDQRIHLTEKILRPIAIGQPFIVASTPGVLKYLKSYGFKTFSSIIDESYDCIQDPIMRLQSIINLMKTISQWSHNQRLENLKKMQDIAKFNKNYFFSDEFLNQIINELKVNLTLGFREVEFTNTSKKFINRRKEWSKIDLLKQDLSTDNSERSRRDLIDILTKARSYYNKHQNK